jgi:PKD repeat protein/ribosomal protein L40E
MGRLIVKVVVILLLLAAMICYTQPALSLVQTVWVSKPSFNPHVESIIIYYSSDYAVNSGTMTINNANDNKVWTHDLLTTAGEHGITWNGRDSNGNIVPNGQYTIYYSVITGSGEFHVITTELTYVTVTTPTPAPAVNSPTPPGIAPKADFFADPLAGTKPLTVHFYDRSQGSSLTYTWDFGDGTSGDQNPVHVYEKAGTYDVALRVTNALGTDQKIIPKYITVTEAGQGGGSSGGQNNGGGGGNGGGSGMGTGVPLSLSLWASPSTVDKNTETVITVLVKDQNNTSVQDVKVNFTVPEGVTMIPAAGITNETGMCQFTFKSSSYGNYTLNATASKQGYSSGYNKTIVAVSGTEWPPCLLTILPFVFVIALIVILALIALFLLLRMVKVRLEPRKTIIPADGKTTIPITITLVNGLGRPKKAKKNTEVAMGTTAGTISDITISAGSNAADAVLTSSKEFGPVVITANYGNKTARANVDFKYGQASLDMSAVPPEIPADGASTSTITIKVKNEAGEYIAPLEEKIVELHTTLGRIQSPVRLPPKAQSLSAVLTAGDAGGTAIITALMGNVKGETQVTLKGALKRFCMHCGSTMTMEASKCPRCGQIPFSGVDVKQCTTCSTVIPEAAKYCDKCGARQPEKAVQPPAQEPKKE